MNKIILILVSCLALVACSAEGEEEKVPAHILDKNTFAKVLADLSLAESAATLNVKNVALEKIDSVYAFDPFVINKITRAQYDSAAAFYAAHPYLYKDAYEMALNILSEMQARKKASADTSRTRK